MKERMKLFLLVMMKFLGTKVLPFTLALLVVVALTFLFWKPFSFPAFSERLVWTGIIVATAAGVVMASQATGGRNYGVPNQFMNTAHGRVLHDWNIEIRRDIESKFDNRILVFLGGVLTFLSGVLVQMVTK